MRPVNRDAARIRRLPGEGGRVSFGTLGSEFATGNSSAIRGVALGYESGGSAAFQNRT